MRGLGLRRHERFYLALAAAAVVALLVPGVLMTRLLAASEVLFALYLALTWAVARRLRPEDLRRHASAEDEGISMILAIAALAVGVSLVGVFDALAEAGLPLWRQLLALAAVPLGWASLHTLFAFRYAHLWYAPDEDDDPATAPAGLDFGEGTDAPGVAEFLYYSFTIGMTAQTSDVGLRTSAMRRLTLLHGVLSFFYNAVLIALAVNAGLQAGGPASGG